MVAWRGCAHVASATFLVRLVGLVDAAGGYAALRQIGPRRWADVWVERLIDGRELYDFHVFVPCQLLESETDSFCT